MSATLSLSSTSRQTQPWVYSAAADLGLILSPAFLVTLAVLLMGDMGDSAAVLPFWAWVGLILSIDVAHVYSTLFRTYLNPVERERHRTLLTAIPLACWMVGAMLYSVDALFFWRMMAYVAVFHFIRQQYGFMRIYARQESPEQQRFRWLDATVLYLSMLYPLVYWHTHLPRNFNWFVEGDFISALPPILEPWTLGLFILFGSAYGAKEIACSVRAGHWNLPKNFLILGTALSWNIGIVVFNGDMAFTATNVVSHGIPYMALVWLMGRKSAQRSPEAPAVDRLPNRLIYSLAAVPLFIFFLWLLAFLEEGFWAGLVWREHLGFFRGFSELPMINDAATLAWLVPLLSLPQLTHYVLDGFIWRLKPEPESWAESLSASGVQEIQPTSFSTETIPY